MIASNSEPENWTHRWASTRCNDDLTYCFVITVGLWDSSCIIEMIVSLYLVCILTRSIKSSQERNKWLTFRMIISQIVDLFKHSTRFEYALDFQEQLTKCKKHHHNHRHHHKHCQLFLTSTQIECMKMIKKQQLLLLDCFY